MWRGSADTDDNRFVLEGIVGGVKDGLGLLEVFLASSHLRLASFRYSLYIAFPLLCLSWSLVRPVASINVLIRMPF